jgi:hypothetical protein
MRDRISLGFAPRPMRLLAFGLPRVQMLRSSVDASVE